MHPWPRIAIAVVALGSLSMLGGCGDEKAGLSPRPPQRTEMRRERAVDAVGAPSVAPKPAAPELEQSADAAANADAGGAPGRLPRRPESDAAAPPMVIRTGNASVEVDTLEPAVRSVQQLATRLGGYVANTSIQGGREQLRQAMLELKVPAERFEELTSGLSPLGTVEYVTVNTEDVGEEYTDITARVANARRLEERLIDLLTTRTGKLQDVLAVERELARVRETIERYEGRLRYLKTRVAMSTLAVTLHEPPPLLHQNPGHNVIVEAFIRAWRNFVAVVAALISSLGILIPLAAVAALAVFLWRRYRKP